MTQVELEQIKQVQLRIMDEIHRVCTENAITYYLIGGTVLGAVRHKGFIPWDVDIDVAMPREDYERFKTVCGKKLAEQYCYCDYQNMQYYPRPHALICDRQTVIRMKYDSVNPVSEGHGIYVDIFPLDNAPDEPVLRERQAKKLRVIRRFKQYRIPYSYSHLQWKRIAHYVVSGMLAWIPIMQINKYQQKVMQTYRERETQCICSMGSQYPYEKQCMPREVYGKPALLEFEGRQYYAPARYEEYLTRLYGDYMQLPPEEKRRANLSVYASVEFL